MRLTCFMWLAVVLSNLAVSGAATAITLMPGDIIAAGGVGGLTHIDPGTGQQTALTDGEFIDFTVAPTGRIFALTADGVVVDVDPDTGDQTVIASGDLLVSSRGISANQNGLFVFDHGAPLGEFATGRIIRINPSTGSQSLVVQDIRPAGLLQQHPQRNFDEDMESDTAGNLVVALFSSWPVLTLTEGENWTSLPSS